MNKRAKELIQENRKIRIASFVMFWVGVVISFIALKFAVNIFLLIGLILAVFGFFLLERSNYHIGALKGYDMGYYDSVKGHNYNVIYSPKDAED